MMSRRNTEFNKSPINLNISGDQRAFGSGDPQRTCCRVRFKCDHLSDSHCESNLKGKMIGDDTPISKSKSRLDLSKSKMDRFSVAQNLPKEQSVVTIEIINTQFETFSIRCMCWN
jgi:hypothetical protein